MSSDEIFSSVKPHMRKYQWKFQHKFPAGSCYCLTGRVRHILYPPHKVWFFIVLIWSPCMFQPIYYELCTSTLNYWQTFQIIPQFFRFLNAFSTFFLYIPDNHSFQVNFSVHKTSLKHAIYHIKRANVEQLSNV